MATRLIDTTTAAREKDCSRVAVLDAIKRGEVDGERTGRYFVIRANARYEEWHPNPKIQAAGKARWKGVKRAKRKG